jgi:hypothetical protein
VNLDDPAVTVALLREDAVVGLTGFFDRKGRLTSVGIQCALCHSTVDDSLAPGIGRRRDGWANRDLNVGAIISLAPRLQPVADILGVSVDTLRQVLGKWGPGKFDAEVFLDGKGTFFDPRLDDAARFPIAARERFGHVRAEEDQITPLLGVLQIYQLALPVPSPPRGSYDRASAARGEVLFNDKAKCSTCHVPPLFTEPGWNMHTAEEIGIDDFQSERAPDRRYRTSPLRGLWTHQKGGFYHDGRFPTLAAVISHYDGVLGLALSARERADLEQYLRSL